MENRYPKLILKDLTHGLNLSAKEILEYEKIVEKLNKIAEQNPEYIDYLRDRYPRSDPRLSELRYKLDDMTSASDEYMETHFPINKSLYNKVQDTIKKNIKLTDPKNFKNVKDPVSFDNLLAVKYITQNGAPKKKLRLQSRNKQTAARFLKKPRLKSNSEKIDEKIKQLDIDMEKTQRKKKK
jgi:hypothetical protein